MQAIADVLTVPVTVVGKQVLIGFSQLEFELAFS